MRASSDQMPVLKARESYATDLASTRPDTRPLPRARSRDDMAVPRDSVSHQSKPPAIDVGYQGASQRRCSSRNDSTSMVYSIPAASSESCAAMATECTGQKRDFGHRRRLWLEDAGISS